MQYTPRPGIARVSLCGTVVLVPSRAAFGFCKNIQPLSLFESMIWTGIEKNYPVEKILEGFHIFSKAPDDELIAKIDNCCQKLLEKGFILPKPEEAGSNAP